MEELVKLRDEKRKLQDEKMTQQNGLFSKRLEICWINIRRSTCPKAFSIFVLHGELFTNPIGSYWRRSKKKKRRYQEKTLLPQRLQ